jgi:uncharacterized membrane protein
MKKVLVPVVLLAICYVLLFAYVALTYGSLPLRVASHFNLYGRPNGWMSRDSLVAFTLGFGIFLPVFIVGVMAGAGRIPVSFVNIPHREYWLALERRRETSAILFRFSLWLGAMMVLFITGLHALIVKANSVPGENHFSGAGTALVAGGFLLGTGIWCVLLVRRFARPPSL